MTRDVSPIPPSPPSDAQGAPGAGIGTGPRITARFTVLLGNETDAAEVWHRNARGLLEAQGVETLVARTGREALGLMEESVLGKGRRIHVAVLDQRMPAMGGLQILRRLQQDLQDLADQHAAPPPTPPTADHRPPSVLPPAILLADTPGSGLMHDALRVRVFSVLPKPIELNLLLDTLARALRRHYQNKWPEGRSDEG